MQTPFIQFILIQMIFTSGIYFVSLSLSACVRIKAQSNGVAFPSENKQAAEEKICFRDCSVHKSV